MSYPYCRVSVVLLAALAALFVESSLAFCSSSSVVVGSTSTFIVQQRQQRQPTRSQRFSTAFFSSSSSAQQQQQEQTATAGAAPASQKPQLIYDYEIPEDAIIHIKPNAMKRLRELRVQQKMDSDDFKEPMYLRMGVRSGGCSGMSYVMDFISADQIVSEDNGGDSEDDRNTDTVDVYQEDQVYCVVDAKSMLYLYGLELDYSDELIGGGFKFFNPNAEESCGCGSSFGI